MISELFIFAVLWIEPRSSGKCLNFNLQLFLSVWDRVSLSISGLRLSSLCSQWRPWICYPAPRFPCIYNYRSVLPYLDIFINILSAVKCYKKHCYCLILTPYMLSEPVDKLVLSLSGELKYSPACLHLPENDFMLSASLGPRDDFVYLSLSHYRSCLCFFWKKGWCGTILPFQIFQQLLKFI